MTADSQSPLWRLVARKSHPIVPLGGEGSGWPLYFVHSIGGEVTSFSPLAKKIGSNRKVYGIQAPRDKMSAEFAQSIRALADYYVDALTQFQPDGLLLLGGWSSGAIIALEMAHILKKRGRSVPLLIILDGILYNTGGELSAWNPLYHWKLIRNLPLWISDNIAEGWGFRGVFKRIQREMKLTLSALLNFKRKAPGATVDAFMDTSILPPKQADFARALYHALELYQPRPYEGEILVYTARTQPLLHLLQVDRTWRKITTDIETVYVDGTHLSILKEPRVGVVAAHLHERLVNLHWPDQTAGEPIPAALAATEQSTRI